MQFFLRIKEFIVKLQNLPLWQKKVILWAITTILGVVLIFFWWNSTKEGLKKINSGDVIKQFVPSMEEENLLNEENFLQLPNLEEQKEKKQNGR